MLFRGRRKSRSLESVKERVYQRLGKNISNWEKQGVQRPWGGSAGLVLGRRYDWNGAGERDSVVGSVARGQ